MELYVLRHGEAEPRGPNTDEADRALTRRGKRDVQAVLRAVRKARLGPQLILTSPLRRARETAAVASAVFPEASVVATDRLKPSASSSAVWKEACADASISRVLLVGHEPQLSHLIAFLLDAPVSVDFKKGALLRIDCAGRLGRPQGVLKWFLTPRVVRSL
jgi:phosphohistidine phosphatase